MEILMIIGGIVLSYVVFVLITCWVARMMFPKIEITDDDLLDFEGLRRLRSQIARREDNSRAQISSQGWLKSQPGLKSNPQLWSKV